MLHEVFYWVLSMSIVATLTGGIVCLLSAIKRIPRRVAVFLWIVPFVRMAIPFGINSPYGLMALLSRVATKTLTVWHMNEHIAVSMTNMTTAADTYFPITYKTDMFQTVFSVASVVWIVGVLVLLVLFASTYYAAIKDVKTATLLESNVYTADGCRSPAVYGIFHPKILLPPSLPDEDRELVLVHERMHIRRGDNCWRLLGILIVTVHWFNPFAWWFLKRFLADLEMACDESVLAELDDDRMKEYASVLLNSHQSRAVLVSAFGGAKMKARICNILSYKKLTWYSLVASAALVVTLAYVLLTNAG